VFCGYAAGSWKICPNCGAPKTNIGKWLARKWNVPLPRKVGSIRIQPGTAMYHRDGQYWNNLTNFPGALFDPSGYVLFEDEKAYRNSRHLKVKTQTNISPFGKKLPEIEGYVVGNPPLKRNFDFGEVEEEEIDGGFVYALHNPAWKGWIKLGKTQDTDERLGTYQTGSPLRDYSVIRSIRHDNPNRAEKMAHAIARVMSGEWNAHEWFRISHKQANAILNLVKSN